MSYDIIKAEVTTKTCKVYASIVNVSIDFLQELETCLNISFLRTEIFFFL